LLTPSEKNFQSWYSDVIRSLCDDRGAGFVLLLITLPLLERYARQKLGLSPQENLTDRSPFYDELVNLVPELGTRDDALNFWRVYRNGLLHAVTLSSETRGGGIKLPASAVSHDKSACFLIDPHGGYWLNPALFAKRVLNIIESDFKTFEIGLHAAIAFPQVYDNTVGPGVGDVWIMAQKEPERVTWTAVNSPSSP
jgi:hypothetical protein